MEGLTVLLDSSILIGYFRSPDKSQTAFYRFFSSSNAALSSVTLMEMEFGVRAPGHRQFIDQLLQKYPVLSFGPGTAQVAGNLYRRLRQNSISIDVRDLMIASTALECGLPLATLNRAHFENVPDLRLFDL